MVYELSGICTLDAAKVRDELFIFTTNGMSYAAIDDRVYGIISDEEYVLNSALFL